jgi:autotransporter-associated beta strand protein
MAVNLSRTQRRRNLKQRRLLLESLEDRHLMAAIDDAYSAGNSALISVPTAGGLTANDTPAGAIVTRINGQAANVGTPVVLPSGATLNASSSGAFVYDASTSATFRGLAAGATASDSFTYQNAPLFAGALATFAFDTVSGPDNAAVPTGVGFNPAVNGTGYSVTPVTKSPDANMKIGVELQTYSNPVLRADPGANATTPALAVTNNRYFEFTITPTAGNAINLSDISFKSARGGGGTPRGWALRSSLDGFAADIQSADDPTARPTLTPFTVSLAGTAYQGLTTPVTFRIYTYSPGAGSSVEFDDLTINGSVAETATANITVRGVAYENLESYAAATQINTQNGGQGFAGPWTVVSARIPEVTVVNANLSYTAGELSINGGSRALQYKATEGTANPLASRPLPSQSGPLYLSLLYQNSVDPDNGADDFMQFGFDTTALANPNASIFDRVTFNARAVLTGHDAAVTNPATTPAGTTYFLVLRVDKVSGSTNYNRVSIFVNPTTAAEPGTPSAVVTFDTTLASISQLAIRRAGQEVGDTYLMDEFRVGTNWSDVITVAPPASGDVLWDGEAGDGRWDNPVNWVGNSNIPDAPGETAIFRDAGAGTIDLNGATYTFSNIRFQNTAAATYTINNGTLAVDTIRQEGAGTNTLNAHLSKASGFSGTVSGGLLSITDVTNTLGGAFNVTGGVLGGAASGTASALGTAALNLNGGTFRALPGPTSTYEGLQARLIANPAADPVTDSAIAAALAQPDVATRVEFARAIDFIPNADAAFASFFNKTTTETNTFATLYTGRFTVTTAGTYTFLASKNDDRAFIWIDRDGDHVFSTAGAAGSELITSAAMANSNTGVNTVDLPVGTYDIVLGVRDTGTNSGLVMQYGQGNLNNNQLQFVRPFYDPGRFTFTGAAGPGNFKANAVTVGSAGGTIDVGTGAGGAIFGSLDMTSGGTLGTTSSPGSGNVPDAIRFEGTVTLPAAGNAVFNPTTGDVAITGQVTGTGGINKTGVGNLFLANGANNYAGVTNITNGSIIVTKDGALGTVAGGTVVNGGRLISYDINTYATLEPLTLSGNFGGGGAFLTRGNALTWAGPITLAASAEIQSDDRSLTLTGPINLGSFTLTFDAGGAAQNFTGDITIPGNQMTGAGGIAKIGGGTLNLPTAQGFSGTATINGGTTIVGDNLSLGTGTIALQSGTLRSNGATPAADRAFANDISFTGDITLGDGTNTGILTFNGPGTLTGNRTITTNSQVVYNGAIGDGTNTFRMNKAGTALMILAGANTYDGDTVVSAGTLRITNSDGLGAATATAAAGGTRVLSGATLELSGNLTLPAENFEISGTGQNNAGAINVVGNVSLPGNIGLAGSAIINLSAASNLAASGTVIAHTTGDLVFSGPGNATFSGDIVDSTPITISSFDGRLFQATGLNIGSATTTPNNINTIVFTGTPASTGTLAAAMAVANDAAFGTIFNNTAISPGTTNFTAAFTATVTVTTAGLYYIAPTNNDDGAAAWIDRNNDGVYDQTELALATTGNGSTTMPAPIALTPGNYKITYVVQDTGGGSSLTGRFEQSFAGAAAATTLPIATPGTAAGITGIVMNGTGTVTLSGNNSYTGLTTINSGTLAAGSANALGATTAGTNVTGPGRLGFTGGVTVAAEPVTANNGTLDNLAGDNTFLGNVTVAPNNFLKLDFGKFGQRVEQGFVGITPPANTNTNDFTGNLPTTSLTSSTGIAYTLAMDAVNQAGATSGTLDWRDRGDATAAEPLVRVGEDQVKNNSGIIRLVLSGLPAGSYSATAWHLNTGANDPNSAQIDVYVGNGAAPTLVTPPGTPGNGNINVATNGQATAALLDQSKSTFTFTADGINNVIIVFNGTPGSEDQTDLDGIVINSLDVGQLALNAAASTSLTLSGVIDDGAAAAKITKTGAGNVILANANTYDGQTIINAGTLTAANNTALGAVATGTTINDTGRLMLAGNVTVAEPITTSGNATLGSSAGVNTLTSDVQLGPGSLTIDVATGAALVHSGGISDGANTVGVTKTGLGVYVANGTNTFDGTLNHNAGFLFGTGSFTSPVNVATNAVISAGGGYQNGAFSDFGLPTTLSIPASAPLAGTLTTGSITLANTSISTTDVTSTAADKLVVKGTVNIAPGTAIGTGEIVGNFTPTGTIVVVDNDGTDPVVGEFAQLPNQPNGFTFSFDGFPAIIYYNYNADTNTIGDGNDIAILFNRPPVATNDTFSLSEDGSVSGNVLTNVIPNGADSDPDGDPLSNVTLVGAAPPGVFNLAASGAFTYTPTPNLSGPITFQYRVQDSNSLPSNVATVTLNIAAVADAPTLGVSPASGNEDTNIPLSISGALVDTDGSETLAYVITGVPAGATLSAGLNAGGGVWNLTAAQVSGLTIRPAAGSDVDFTLSVLATATESAGGSAQTAASLAVTVNAVADAPTLTVSPASGNEDTAIPLVINGSLNDPDGSETLTYQISGVPPGATLSAGTNAGGGVWNLTSGQVAGLFLNPPANSDVGFTLTVTAIATEAAGGTAQTSQSLPVTLNAVADPPTLTVTSPVTTLEDTAVALNIVGALTDPGETLSYQITGVPAGAAFTNAANVAVGTNAGGGVWNFTPAEITAGIRLTPPLNSDADYTTASGNALTVIATSTDTGNLTASTSRTLEINVTAVADPPVISAPATVRGNEYTWLPLGLTATLADTDGSETMVLTIDGVPADAEISTGTKDPVIAGRWIVVGDVNITSAAIRKRDNNANNAPFTLSVFGTATEADPNGAPRTASTNPPAQVVVTVLNAAPQPRQEEVQISGVPQDTTPGFITVVPGLAVTYVVATRDVAFPDPGEAGASVDAPFTFRFEFEPGKVVTINNVSAEDELVSVTYAFSGLGNFQPTLTVTDKPHGTWVPDPTKPTQTRPVAISTTINLTPVKTVTQQLVDGVLYVGGGLLGDRIIVSPSGFGGTQVRINNQLLPRQDVSEKVVIFGNAGADTISSTGNVLVPVEFYGGDGDDYLSGGRWGDTLDGGAGKDRLLGGGGNDTLLGGSGNDSLSGGDGDDYLSGDEYIDFLGGTPLDDGSLSEPGQVLVSATPGNDVANGDKGNDILLGQGGIDTLNGGLGNDFVRGGEGGDRITGGDGNDLLLGEGGSDNLQGQQGRDVLIGGTGTDQLSGGLSSDLLYASDIDAGILDDFSLQELWVAWQKGQSQTAHDLLLGAVVEDNTPDSVNGEQDDDWYLVYIKDRFLLPTEAKSPHVTKLV